MARSNSKYFASVIAKLIAAKRKEKIVIDDAFKSSLRMEVLARARGTVQPEGTDIYDSVREFLHRWRYAFTLVPSALLLVIVAAQVLKMPVSINSEVVVPMTGTKTSSQAVDTSSAVESNDESSPQTTNSSIQTNVLGGSEQKVSKIKTFPGALAMGKKNIEQPTFAPEVSDSHIQMPSINSVKTPTSSLQQPANNSTNGGHVPDRTNEISEEHDTVKSHSEIRTVNPQSENNQDVSENETPAVNAQKTSSLVENSDTVPSNESNTTPTITSVDNQIAPVDQQQIVQESMDALRVTNPTVAPQADQVSPEQTTPAMNQVPSTDMNTATDGNEDLEIHNNKTSNNATMLQMKVKEPAYPIYYQTDWSDQKKANFEKAVFGPNRNQDTVSHVMVTEQEGGVIAVETYYTDGSIATNYYKKNAATGSWDNVEFVTNYYYDNDLQYVRNFQYDVFGR